jgi:transposase
MSDHSSSSSSSRGRVRVQRPERKQIEWRAASLDQMIPSDHRVRMVWAYVEGLDLTPLYEKIRAVEGHAGRDPVDPRMLMALWMFATIEGIGSARGLARLCQRDLAYMWICGGVGVNYHLLSDFRTLQGDVLDQLLTDTVATLLHQGLVTLDVVAQDGMRVRAHAGSSSFRRQQTLERCRQAAAEQVQRLKEERSREERSREERSREERPASDADGEDEGNDPLEDPRRQAARSRAARERMERVDQALEELAQLQQQKEKRKKGSGQGARSSTTDPEARVMKMADGGFRPAYNVQFASDGQTRLIVSVDVTNSGCDRGHMAPMHAEITTKYGKLPQNYLVDAGFTNKDDVTALEQRGTKVFAPIVATKAMQARGVDPHSRRRNDSDEMYAFRQRMATDEAKALYQQRPSIAEFPNADCRNRGLTQFRVRGLLKARAVALWHAIAFNFLRMLNLGCVG